MVDHELVGERFVELRNRCGFTQRIMAEYLDFDPSYISKCEKSDRQFSVGILDKAAELLGCSMDCLVNESTGVANNAVALRTKSLAVDDLEAFAAINKIALNLRFMEGLVIEKWDFKENKLNI